MAHFIKSILFLVIVVALNGIADQAFTSQEASGEDCGYSWQLQQHTQHFDKTSLPYLPDAELGSIGLQTNHLFSSRLQRSSGGYSFFFKDIVNKLSERNAILFKHWEKESDSSSLSSVTHPICEYYIFALRRIII